jgi:nucleoside phosphorylase
MIYIVTALHAEAATLIENYQLTRVEKKPFSIYQNDDIYLIISGIGKIEAAVATTYLLNHYQVGATDRLFNIGTAASSETSIAIGSLFKISKIIDFCSKHVYHLAQGERALTCVDVAHHTPKGIKTPLIDMESVGVFIAAKKFLPTASIMIVKIVSDYTDVTIPDAKDTTMLIKKQIDTIGALLNV